MGKASLNSPARRRLRENVTPVPPTQTASECLAKLSGASDRVLTIEQIDELDRLADKLRQLGAVAGLAGQYLEEDAYARGLLGILRAVHLLDAELHAVADQMNVAAGTPPSK